MIGKEFSMKLLHIAASPKLDKQSSSKRVANAFIEAYLMKHEQTQCRYIDLNTLEIPHMTKELLEAFESGIAQHQTEQRALQIYNNLCDEFITADRYVISFPNWNLTAPPALVSYILAVIRAGKAFRYTEHGSEGLLHNKKVTLVVASGGITSGNHPKETCTAIVWLKNLFCVCGICDVQVLYCEGIEQMPDQAEEIITAAVQNAKEQGAVWDINAGDKL